MYSDRQTLSYSVDPDQTPQNAASDEGLHCLPLIQQFYSQAAKKDVEENCKIKGINI